MDIKIRKYNDNDYDDVFKIIKEAFSCEKSKANSSFINEYVACLDGNIVGYFYLLDEIDIVKNIKILHLHYICVASKYRGMGIANEMMNFILNYAKDNNSFEKYYNNLEMAYIFHVLIGTTYRASSHKKFSVKMVKDI